MSRKHKEHDPEQGQAQAKEHARAELASSKEQQPMQFKSKQDEAKFDKTLTRVRRTLGCLDDKDNAEARAERRRQKDERIADRKMRKEQDARNAELRTRRERAVPGINSSRTS